MELKAYVTNLGKYNEGYLIGKWVTFPIDEDEEMELMKEIGCYYVDDEGNEYNKEYEEYFVTDYEDSDIWHPYFGEYPSIQDLNDAAEQLDYIDDEDKFQAIVDNWGLDEALNNYDDFYLYSDINDDYDLGYYWIEESGCYDLRGLGNLTNYIDYEAFGRDVALESDGYFSDYGWIERR